MGDYATVFSQDRGVDVEGGTGNASSSVRRGVGGGVCVSVCVWGGRVYVWMVVWGLYECIYVWVLVWVVA